jgi:hypothetical protein
MQIDARSLGRACGQLAPHFRRTSRPPSGTRGRYQPAIRFGGRRGYLGRHRPEHHRGQCHVTLAGRAQGRRLPGSPRAQCWAPPVLLLRELGRRADGGVQGGVLVLVGMTHVDFRRRGIEASVRSRRDAHLNAVTTNVNSKRFRM